MADTEALKEFKEGLGHLGNNYPSKALPHFSKAAELDKHNPFYLSYKGLAIAAAQQNWDEAEELCYTALRKKRNETQLYLNLSEVYRLAGRKADAVEALATGLQFTKKDVRLTRALRKLGVRRPPVVSFLERTHFLNRHLGKFRHRVLKSLGKE